MMLPLGSSTDTGDVNFSSVTFVTRIVTVISSGAVNWYLEKSSSTLIGSVLTVLSAPAVLTSPSSISRAQKSAKIRFFIISPSGSAQPPFLLPRHAPEKADASSRNHACPLPSEMEPHTLSYFTR